MFIFLHYLSAHELNNDLSDINCTQNLNITTEHIPIEKVTTSLKLGKLAQVTVSLTLSASSLSVIYVLMRFVNRFLDLRARYIEEQT